MASLLRVIDEAADHAQRSPLPVALSGSLASLSAQGRGGLAWARYYLGARDHLGALWNAAQTDGARRQVLVIAEWFVSGGGPRNGVLDNIFDPKFPSDILDELDDTNTALLTLGRDISRAFCVPFRAQLAARVAAFEKKNGRPPNNEESREMLRVMGVSSPESPTSARCYHSAFVSAWSSFLGEWTSFYLGKQAWLSRQWRGIWVKTVAYKRASLDWRAEFERRGGAPSAPKPQIPPTDSSMLPSFGKVMLVLGAVAAIVIVPPLLRTAGGK